MHSSRIDASSDCGGASAAAKTSRDASRGIIARVHRDERGVISVTAVLVLFMFTILLMMLVNTATHLDDKIKMQNAADAGGYSAGVVLARGMNTLAYTNHLLSDTFAITAFLREGRDRQAEQITPEILDEWERIGQKFSEAEFEKFKLLGQAMLEKVSNQPSGLDRELIAAYGELTQAASDYALPVFEYALTGEDGVVSVPGGGIPNGAAVANPEGGLIPRFQRIVIQSLPLVAQTAASSIAARHGVKNTDLDTGQPRPAPSNGRQAERNDTVGVMWRMNVMPVGYPDENDPLLRTLPAVDPSPLAPDFAAIPNGDQYYQSARNERDEYARHYLEMWTRDKLQLFERDAQMARFSHLWRIFTCAQLDRMLNDEFPATNLPMMIRLTETGQTMAQLVQSDSTGQQVNQHLELNFNFLSLAYRQHLRETGPGLFKNPINRESDAVAFAQVSLFLPRPRRYLALVGGGGQDRIGLGGTLGNNAGIDGAPVQPTVPEPPSNPFDERWPSENWPRHWDLWNQNWTVKIVPATAPAIPDILQAGFGQDSTYRPPNLGNVTIEEINRINTH